MLRFLVIFLLSTTNLFAQVYAMTQNRDGAMWIAVDKQIVKMAKDGISNDSIRLEETIHALVIDRSGTLWAGGDRGLLQCSKNQCKQDSRVTMSVRALAIDQDNQLLIGTRSGLIQLTDQGTTPVSFHSNIVDALAFDSSGALWIGSGHEVIRREDGKSKSYTLPLPPANVRMRPPITSILPVKTNHVYVGTHQGLLSLDHGNFKKLFDTEVLALIQDPQGNILIGTSDGLLRMQGGKLIDVPITKH
jgi:ligand-binding sensor domain-containing protein